MNPALATESLGKQQSSYIYIKYKLSSNDPEKHFCTTISTYFSDVIVECAIGNYHEARVVTDSREALLNFCEILERNGGSLQKCPAKSYSLYQDGDLCFPESSGCIYVDPTPQPALVAEAQKKYLVDCEPRPYPSAKDSLDPTFTYIAVALVFFGVTLIVLLIAGVRF